MPQLEKKAIIENMESVDLSDLVVKTWVRTGFDENTTDEHKRDVVLEFTGFDSIDDRVKTRLMEEFAAKLRIQANSPSCRVMKAHPEVGDSESYAEYLDKHDCTFTFDVNELYAKVSREQSPEDQAKSAIWKMYKESTISEEKRDKLLELVELDTND